jgi:hypothetical protein
MGVFVHAPVDAAQLSVVQGFESSQSHARQVAWPASANVPAGQAPQTVEPGTSA